MSISGITGSNFLAYNGSSGANTFQQIRQDFQQLGQDLGAGNLSAAQADFAALQQVIPQGNSTSTGQNTNSVTQAFGQLAQDLQAGNLSAAQQDFSNLQQDIQQQAPPVHHHHHAGAGGGGQGSLATLFTELGQDLQTGNLSAAQQAYNSLQADFPQFAQNGQQGGDATPQNTTGVSVNV